MDSYIFYTVLFVLLLILLGLGLPIAFVLGSISVIGIIWALDYNVLYQLAQIALDTGSNFIFTMIPLFILMAEIFSISALGKDAFSAAQKWFYRLPGSLAVSGIGSSAGFAAVSGSSPVTVAVVGIVAVPEMISSGYDRKLAAGSVAAGGTLGIMIPPSMAMIIYGVITETSVGKLFIGGIVPGILLAIMLSLLVVIRVKLNPSLAPSLGEVSWRQRLVSLLRVWPVVVISIAVIGSIYTGIATPTEAASVGASGALLIMLILGRLNVLSLYKALMRTATTTCMALFLILGGLSVSFFVSTMGIPHEISNFLQSLSVSPWIIIVLINLIYLILGCFLDPMSILVITLPLIFPTVNAMGFDPIWFGIVVTLNIEIGMIIF